MCKLLQGELVVVTGDNNQSTYIHIVCMYMYIHVHFCQTYETLLCSTQNVYSILILHNKLKAVHRSESVSELCFKKAGFHFTFPGFDLDSTLILWGLCWFLVWGHEPTDDIKQLLTGHLINRYSLIYTSHVQTGKGLKCYYK